jgi:beta-phosphoglucomutase
VSVSVIFDVDGVLIDTPHERAWQAALQALMQAEWRDLTPQTRYSPEAFTTAVYQQYVAGKPRLDGATSVLAYFGVPDPAQRASVYGERKQAMIEDLLQRGEFVAFADGLRLVLGLHERGVRLGVASSSRNANQFMERVPLRGQTLRTIFDANVCGRDVPRGKPDPAIFLLAAQELGVSPASCVVVEDASSGIQAARSGGMLGLGVARHDDAALLEAAGANLVVTNLDEVAVDALVAGRLERSGEKTGGRAAALGE